MTDNDEVHLLKVKDVVFNDWGCVISVYLSKTIQFHERDFRVPVSYVEGALCAVSLLLKYLKDYPKKSDDFLFQLPGSGPIK